MIECKSGWEIVSFDGRVVERYHPNGASEHYHIDYLESAEITTDRKGRHYLKINPKVHGGFNRFTSPELAPEEVPQAQALVDEVNRVIASR